MVILEFVLRQINWEVLSVYAVTGQVQSLHEAPEAYNSSHVSLIAGKLLRKVDRDVHDVAGQSEAANERLGVEGRALSSTLYIEFGSFLQPEPLHPPGS